MSPPGNRIRRVVAFLKRYWPFFILPIILGPLNVDLVVVPALQKSGLLTGWRLFGLASMLAITELVYWYFFWRSLGRAIASPDPVKADIVFLKWILNIVKDYFAEKYRRATDENNKLLKFLKGGGFLALVIVSALPLPMARVVGTIFWSSTGSTKNLVALIIGDLLHTASVIYSWSQLFALMNYLIR